MDPEIVPIHRKEFLREDGMLFVRTDGILDTMTKIPLLVASMIIVAAVMPIQSSFSSPRILDLVIYPDGSTHVSSEIDVDPLVTDFELDLFGSTIDNFVVVNENGFLLTTDVLGNSALVETFGSSVITVDYDIHDLVSKQGRVWTFSLDAPSDFTLLLPKNSAIVGMTNLPINMEIINDQNQLTLSAGETEIDYLFGTIPNTPDPTIPNTPDPTIPNTPDPTIPNTPDPTIPVNPTSQSDNLTYAIIGGITVAAIIGGAAIIRIKQKTVKSIHDQQTIQKTETIDTETIDTETIFKLKPDLREDDKEIVWRAVKRLERNGVVEIEKKDLQNLVKLRKNMEEEK
jgi:hypothetical protein